MCRGAEVGLHCSDVSGAFDHVSTDKLIRKLAACGVNSRMLQVVRSWLRDHKARVVVAGAESEEFRLSNIVFQGTVWGPPFWNAFFNDSASVLRQLGFCVVVYADDYNAFQVYQRRATSLLILCELREFQRELQKWGRGNQVKFDAANE